MFVSTIVGGVKVDFLLDSGSTATLLSQRIYEAIPQECRPTLVNVSTDLVSANGTPMQSYGIAKLVFSLGDQKFSIHAIICDMQSDAILGQDFNLKHIKSINFERNHLLTKDDICIPFRLGGKAAMSCRVTCARRCLIPARSIRNIAAEIPSSEYLGSSIMLEPSQAAYRNDLLLAPQILPNKTGKPLVTVINTKYEDREVYENTYLGTAESACDRKDCGFTRRETVRQTKVAESTVEGALPDHLKDVVERSSGFLTPEQIEKFKERITKFEHIYSRGPDDLGHTDWTTFKINTGNAKPIRQPYRRLPIAKREAERAEIKRMLEQNIIEESSSPWASPICLVSKPDGGVRFCVDFRKLNEVTEKDAFPLPRIDECLDALSGAEFFGTQDLCSGFWQISLDSEEDREKTAFLTSMGLYQFTILCFGLTNAPACFQRLMQEVLRGLQWSECVLFMDDTIVPSKDFEEGLERLTHVWERFSQAGLKLKPSKCLYFQREIRFLGHIVSKDGVRTDPAKTEAIDNWPLPTSAKQMKSFLGLASYYRRFIQGFAVIARPLHQLCDKKVKFQWNKECDQAFKLLKEKLVSAPILAYPIVGEQYVLDTDACDVAVGGVLGQIQDGEEKVIAYYSKALTKSEINYCVTRKELLAVIHGLRKFHCYLYGQKILLRTDNSAVSWIRNLKAPSGQVARWLQELGTYDLDVQHRSATHHRNADALSRSPCSVCLNAQERENLEPATPRCCAVTSRVDPDPAQMNDEETVSPASAEPQPGPSTADSQTQIGSRGATAEEKRDKDDKDTTYPSSLEWEANISCFIPPKWTKEELRAAQLKDESLGPVLRWKEEGKVKPVWAEVSAESHELKILWAAYERLGVVEGVLVRFFLTDLGEWMAQILVPRDLRPDVLHLAHDIPSSGHLATEKMLDRLKRNYYWPKLSDSVTRYVIECDRCTARKTPKGKRHAALGSHLMGEPMERVSMDILGPLPVTTRGNKYILVVCDHFSKWCEAYALPNQEAATIARVFVNEFVCRWGAPLQILTDQARNFESRVIRDVCSLLHIDKSRTTSYNPKANGVCERFNRTLQNMIAMYCTQNQRNWDEYLPQLLMAYRSTRNGSTNQTPNRMALGRDITLPMEAVSPNIRQPRTLIDTTEHVVKLQEQLSRIHDLARKNLKRSATYQKKRYDMTAQKRAFQRGDLVWVHEAVPKPGLTQKLAPLWKGPFLITRRVDDLVYMVKRGADLPAKAHHIDRLLKYRGNRRPRWC